MTIPTLILAAFLAQFAQNRADRPPGAPPVVPRAPVCASQPSSELPPKIPDPRDFVELERTQCFGACPVYTVRIHADGRVDWTGRSVRNTGPTTSSIRVVDARALIEKFRTSGFWSLCEKFGGHAEDAPTVVTTLGLGGHEKKVSNGYLGGAPDFLNALELEIDEVAGTYERLHGDPRSETVASIRMRGGGVISTNLRADAVEAKPGVTPLMRAAAKGDVREIERLLAERADRNSQDSSGWTALTYASQADRADAIQLLLDAGSNPNLPSHLLQTPLMAVSGAYSSKAEKARLLIAAGADVNAQDRNGRTALMFAMFGILSWSGSPRGISEELALITVLRQAGARTNIRDVSGLTVFDYLDAEVKIYSNAPEVQMILQILRQE